MKWHSPKALGAAITWCRLSVNRTATCKQHTDEGGSSCSTYCKTVHRRERSSLRESLLCVWLRGMGFGKHWEKGAMVKEMLFHVFTAGFTSRSARQTVLVWGMFSLILLSMWQHGGQLPAIWCRKWKANYSTWLQPQNNNYICVTSSLIQSKQNA